ncbi:DUF3592 domain-containing protein [Streptomyces sp. RKND-216]|uniref:DUF3592 domain-containing protein n=1 Tax=Streptomyces sp. RKND-216 TaxID=2562581 RepID=UPI00109E2311|nr:DUF3592 domain-containing protein [Streptomyces sp. RKND-216]THA25657.1 DUF3592 domain-containing protein [Streptomyces sp. RKND-216]
MAALFVLFVPALLVGLPLFVWGWVMYDRLGRLERSGVPVQGQVVDVRYRRTDDGHRITHIVLWHTAEGQPRHRAVRFPTAALRWLHVGSPVTVRYDPRHPSRALVDGAPTPKGTAVTLMVFGGIVLAVALLLLTSAVVAAM